jgi:2-oxo-4-hydroxy-4-carboxy-5-ureidoimidazoline decarboxylase
LSAPLAIEAIDSGDAGTARAALGPLFEDAPRFLDRLIELRPFGDWPTLFDRAGSLALSMPEPEQLELIDAHPRIGAPPASVSALSFREQGYDREQAEAIAALEPLNDAYEARFGFRYVVFVAGRPRSAIVPLLRSALDADRDAEIRRALGDVVAIARARAERPGAEAVGPAEPSAEAGRFTQEVTR